MTKAFPKVALALGVHSAIESHLQQTLTAARVFFCETDVAALFWACGEGQASLMHRNSRLTSNSKEPPKIFSD